MEKDHKRSVGPRHSRERTETQFSPASSDLANSHSGTIVKKHTKKRSLAVRDRVYVSETSHRTGHRFPGGFLLPYVRRPQKIRRTPTSHRPKKPEFLSPCTTLQDGVSTYHPQSTAGRRLGSHIRHERRVFPRTRQPKIQKIPKILHQRQNPSVSSNVLRPRHSTSHIHKANETSSNLSPSASNSHLPLSRRLAATRKNGSRSQKKLCISPRTSQEARHLDQHGQILFRPQTNLRASGSTIQSGTRAGLPNRDFTEETRTLGLLHQRIPKDDSEIFPVFPRPSQLYGRLHSSGKAVSETPTIISKMFLQTTFRQSRHSSTTEPNLLPIPTMVARSEKSDKGRPIASSRSRSHDCDGCKSLGMGRSSECSNCRWQMGDFRTGPTYQSPGDESSPQSVPLFRVSDPEQMCQDPDGQFNGGLIHQTPGGDTFITPFPADARAVPVVSSQEHFSQSSIHPRKEECSGRFSEQKGPSSPDRVDSESPYIHSDPQTIPISRGRSVCDLQESQVADICQSIPGRSGMGDRCNDSGLVRSGGLCIPTKSSDSRNPGQNHKDPRLSSDSCSSSLANPDLVPNTPVSTGRVPTGDSIEQETAEPTGLQHLPLKTRGPTPSRVDVIKRSILQRGFSEEVARRAAEPQRKSSLQLYQSHYKVFSDWLITRGRNLESVNIPLVADYFTYMFNTLNRAPSTIASHRSALSDALGDFDGHSVGSHPVISNLFRSFYVERPPTRARLPEWDLVKVLDYLRSAPFEPPKFTSVEDKLHCTYKTVFLLALATANRAGELQAISRDKRDMVFNKKGVFLRSVPGFMPKTHAINVDPKPYFVPRHDTYAGHDTTDRLLCPIRMLKYYVNFTGGFKESSRLFVKCAGEGEVCTKTISSWLKKIIVLSHDNPVTAKGHQVRKAAVSFAFYAGCNPLDVLRAGSWKRETTFTSHYLQDVAHQLDGFYRFSPVVAAKSH